MSLVRWSATLLCLLAASAAPAAPALSISLPDIVTQKDARSGGVVITIEGTPNTEYELQREGLSDVILATVTTDAAGRARHVASADQLVPWEPDKPVSLFVIGNNGPDDYAKASYRFRPSTRVSLARIPEQLDNHQRMNLHALSGATTYTDDEGRNTQAWAYWSADRRGKIVTRDFPNGDWSQPVDVHDAVTGRELEYDSHNWLSLGVAPNGKLFAAGNMHVDPLQMAESTRAYDWTSLVSMPRSAMGTADTDRVTYPDFFTLRDRLYFIYREQENAGGYAYFRVIIKRYLHESDTWETAAVLNRGRNLRLYVPKVVVSPNGRRAHLLGLWRDDSGSGSGSGSGADNNRDIFHLYSDDGSTWSQYGDGDLALPLWYDNGLGDSGTLVSETIWDTSAEDPRPQNIGSVVVDRSGKPHVLLRARGSGDNYHAWREKGRWVTMKLPRWRSASQTLVTWDGRVGVVLSLADRVEYASLDPAHPTFSSPRKIVEGLTNTRYWVRQDWSAQTRGHLSILLTETLQEPDGTRGSYDRDADVLTIPLPLLESTSGLIADERGLTPGLFDDP